MWNLAKIQKMNRPGSKPPEDSFSRHCSFTGSVEDGIVLHSALRRSTAFLQAGEPAQAFVRRWQAAGSEDERDRVIEGYFAESSAKAIVNQLIEGNPSRPAPRAYPTREPSRIRTTRTPSLSAATLGLPDGWKMENYVSKVELYGPNGQRGTIPKTNELRPRQWWANAAAAIIAGNGAQVSEDEVDQLIEASEEKRKNLPADIAAFIAKYGSGKDHDKRKRREARGFSSAKAEINRLKKRGESIEAADELLSEATDSGLVSHHITCDHPTREIPPQERELHQRVFQVGFQRGFEQLLVNVYSDTCEEGDAEEAATEFLLKHNPNPESGRRPRGWAADSEITVRRLA